MEHTHGGSLDGSAPAQAAPPDPREQVSLRLYHDTILVNIPLRIIYSGSSGENDVGVDQFGEDTITLYISTAHCQSSGFHSQTQVDILGEPLASLFSMRPLSEDSSSDGCFATASNWLQNCLETHDNCPKQLWPLPSRVIDVGNEDRDPFLHVSNSQYSPVLALSLLGIKRRLLLRHTISIPAPREFQLPTCLQHSEMQS